MNSVSVRLNAAGRSPWIPINTKATPFGLAIGCTISSGASLTYSVQHTLDSPAPVYDFSISRTTTVATLTRTNHGLSVGDSVIITGAGAPLDGEQIVVTVADANTLTYTVANSGASSAAAGIVGGSFLRVFNHPTLVALAASADGNYQFPPKMIRLKCVTYVSGSVDMTVISAGE
jgi:hypothetical protein